MLGGFITRGLVLAFGYAYPAFECFKTVEKNRVEIEQLRFWCQYWIIVAVITVFERILDIFVSWLPMYGEAKLALFIYLWYPKTKGCGYVYEAVVRPYIAKHETDIDRSLQELRARAMDMVIYYWQNFSKVGAAKFVEILQYLASQSTHVTSSQKAEIDVVNNGTPSTTFAAPPSPSPPITPSTPSPLFKKNNNKGVRSPMPPTSPTGRRLSQSSESARTHLEFISEETTNADEDSGQSPKQNDVDKKSNAFHVRLRKTKASLQ